MAADHNELNDDGDRVALDDISATEWRIDTAPLTRLAQTLHSMISVLPNGGD